MTTFWTFTTASCNQARTESAYRNPDIYCDCLCEFYIIFRYVALAVRSIHFIRFLFILIRFLCSKLTYKLDHTPNIVIVVTNV